MFSDTVFLIAWLVIKPNEVLRRDRHLDVAGDLLIAWSFAPNGTRSAGDVAV
jgi:hypothetical protein